MICWFSSARRTRCASNCFRWVASYESIASMRAFASSATSSTEIPGASSATRIVARFISFDSPCRCSLRSSPPPCVCCNPCGGCEFQRSGKCPTSRAARFLHHRCAAAPNPDGPHSRGPVCPPPRYSRSHCAPFLRHLFRYFLLCVPNRTICAALVSSPVVPFHFACDPVVLCQSQFLLACVPAATLQPLPSRAFRAAPQPQGLRARYASRHANRDPWPRLNRRRIGLALSFALSAHEF